MITTRVKGTHYLENKQQFRNLMLQFDKKKPYNHYNSKFANLPSFILSFDKKGRLTTAEKDFLRMDIQGIYILKPIDGKVTEFKIVKDVTEIQEAIRMKGRNERHKEYGSLNKPFILQRYIDNPLLLKQRKFDITCLIAIVSVDPLIVQFNNGYSVKTYDDFEIESKSLFKHIVDDELSKTHPNREEEFNFDNTYDWKWLKYQIFDEYKQYTENDILQIEEKMKFAITYAIKSLKDTIVRRNGDIALMSVDFTVDKNLNPYIMGFKNQPFLKDETDVQIQVFSDWVRDFIDAGYQFYSMSRKEISNLSRNDKNLSCQYMRRSLCKVLINEDAGFDYIEQNQEISQKWDNKYEQYYAQIKKVRPLELQELIDEYGVRLNAIQTYYRANMKSALLYNHLSRSLRLKISYDIRQRYKQDLIYQIQDVSGKEDVTDQMTLTMAPFDKFLDDKLEYGRSLKDFDKKKPFEHYNSEYANPSQYQIDFYNLEDGLNESEKEFLAQNNQGMWILKPATTVQGYGITVIHDIQEFEEALRWKEEKAELHPKYQFEFLRPVNRRFTLQKYIENPLIQDKKKFDSRQFLAIMSTDPFIAVYFPGYTRKTMVEYDRFSESEFVHLGNGDIQKKLPNYESIRQNDHNYDRELYKNKTLQDHEHLSEKDFDHLEDKVKAALTYALLAAKDKLIPRKGDMQLFSIDMIVDDNFNPYIVEWNRNPYLQGTTPILAKIFPMIVRDWWDGSAALYAMTEDEIIERSKKDPKFLCEVITQHENCEKNILINDAVGYNFLQELDLENLKKPTYTIFDRNNQSQYYDYQAQKLEAQLKSQKAWEKKHGTNSIHGDL